MIKKIGLLAFAFCLPASAVRSQQSAPLRLLQTVLLPGVHGRIDHFDVDLIHQRLFMSALGNNTLEVFDLRTNRVIHVIRGLHEPQGVTYASNSNRIFVANGDDGTVRIFDGNTYRLIGTVQLPSDADDTRYDAATRQIIVGYGDDRNAGLGILDGASGKLLGTIKLPGHPESFQLDRPEGTIFVNIPTAGNRIAVVNAKEHKIVAMWSLGGAQDNFPMALDTKDHRLFITCRVPAEVLVLDTQTGKMIARVPCVGQADDMWYDEVHRRIYVSGGEGFISIITQLDVNHYRRIAQVRTARGGRTSLLVPSLNRLYLGVWGRGGQPEELRVYKIEP
jgi:WD40 repeat protein